MKARAALLVTVVLAVAVLVGGWFGLVRPKVSATRQARDETQTAQQNTRKLLVSLGMARSDLAGLPAQQQRLRAFRQRMPPSADLPTLVRDLSGLAAANQVELDSLVPGSPAPPGASTGPGAASPSPTPTPSGARTTRYEEIPITMTVTGTYFFLEGFLAALETMPRAMVLTSVALSPLPATPTPTPPAPTGGSASPGTATSAAASPTPSATPSPTAAPTLKAVLRGLVFTSTVGAAVAKSPSSTPLPPSGGSTPSPAVPTPAPTGLLPGETPPPAASPTGAAALGPRAARFRTDRPAPTPTRGDR